MRRWTDWLAFVAWSVAGGLVVFSFLTGLSIGVFVLPFAVAAVFFAASRSSGWPEALGVFAGAGVLFLVIALLSDYTPCPESGVLPGVNSEGDYVFECGGFDPMPWLIGGIALVSVSVFAYVVVRARRSSDIANPS